MTATMEAKPKANEPASTDALRALCLYLSKHDHVPYVELPEALRSRPLMASALVHGYILVGRQACCDTILSVKPVLDTQRKPTYDEFRRQIVKREYETHLDSEISWTNLKGPNRKSFGDLLKEDDAAALREEDGRVLPPLLVKLTTEGLALAI